MANPEDNLENKKEQINILERNTFYKNSLKKQYVEIEQWKMRIEMISNAKNKEMQKLNERMIEKVCKYCYCYYSIQIVISRK